MPSAPFESQPDKLAQSELEQRVLDRWRELGVFERSLEMRAGGEPWVFYEGPPTANGKPGTHHVLARVFKDVFPRFQTMRGRRVERKGGWDCHGLPVELAVEAELGFTGKEDIEEYGIAEFNAKCRESVFEYVEDWNRLTERIGFWIDLDDAYRTLDSSYVESLWWAIKAIDSKGLLYEGHKVVPYCPRCGTALSSHELGQPGAYRDVVDTAAFVRLPVKEPRGGLEAGDELVVWTTTPWTLVSNAAVAVDPDLAYCRVSVDGAVLVVAEALVGKVFGEEAEVLASFPGTGMVGARYEPPFGFIAGSDYGPAGHTVLAADFVTAEDGTGLVHTAIAFGEDDFRLGEQSGLAAVNPVLPDGTYDSRIGQFAGRQVKECDADLVADLESRGRLLRAEPYEHSYPHCWRCSTPLLYYAKPSWYIATSKIRERMLDENSRIDWHPEHVRDGRFGKWLENNVDWALSRERYWGTPLPVWRCERGHHHVIGSFDELEELSGVRLEDPHRPYVDEVAFPCPRCGERMARVPEVIDVWFDSGAMPFAQHHAPLDNADVFEQRFPADFICEALDQTRGWFYSLLAVSTLLFDEASFRSVVCLGLILDADGQKMSKSKGNVVEPWSILDTQGADALRWYFLTSKQPWDGYRFSTDAVDESTRRLLLPLWNVLGFFVLYANAGNVQLGDPSTPPEPANELDRWVLSRLAATVEVVTERLDAFDATTAGREIQDFVEDLSNWYVRRSRRRFWDGEETAHAVLRHVLLQVSRLLAPFCPFMADHVHATLDPDGEPSVHLCDWPSPGARDRRLEDAMAAAREAVTLGLAARGQAKVKVRQPLRAAVIVATGDEREAIEGLGEIVREELNVKELRFTDAADELGRLEVKPNYRTLGPKFGKDMPLAAAAVEGLDPDHVGESLKAGEPVHVNVGGREHALTSDDLLVAMKPLDGYQLERAGSHAVALELAIDEELELEGLAREVVHAVQGARKQSGLEVEDRIELRLDGDERVLAAVAGHSEWIAGEVLASSLAVVPHDRPGFEVEVDSHRLAISLSRA